MAVLFWVWVCMSQEHNGDTDVSIINVGFSLTHLPMLLWSYITQLMSGHLQREQRDDKQSIWFVFAVGITPMHTAHYPILQLLPGI